MEIEDIVTIKGEIQGKEIILETGKLAKQAGGAVVAKIGETIVLSTATVSKDTKEGIDFFPLTVDYFEKLYAAGKIPGGFFKREGRPSDSEILKSRLIDRSLRPLFPKNFRQEVQIISYVLSADDENLPDVFGIISASSALIISNAPFEEAVGACRVGIIDGKMVINPSNVLLEKSDLNLVVSGTKNDILMVEAEANEVSEDTITEALAFAHEEIKKIIELQIQLRSLINPEKITPPIVEIPEDTREFIKKTSIEKIEAALLNKEKLKRESALEDVKTEVKQEVLLNFPNFSSDSTGEIFDKVLKEYVRNRVINENIRIDGRKSDEIRPITCEVSLLPMVHGSGLFTRGQTQVLTVLTLGGKGEGQLIEGLEEEMTKHYMHYYNFPPFSVGETRPMRGPGRREVGHGVLAERALLPVIPGEEIFPYTIRIVSEVLESNGSTSMASVCGSTLALMDAGVPIKAPVAGIAMGLIKENEKYAVLTDIQGAEDALGDMDFKVAGTEIGINALQMDVKLTNIGFDILKEALYQAKKARLFILKKMLEVIEKPRSKVSPRAPRIFTLAIKPDKIGLLIGPGGKTIKKITEENNVAIDIENDGRIYITAPNETTGEKAVDIILALTEDAIPGKVYLGKVTELRDFGAFVEIAPGKIGLLHISQVSDSYVKDVSSILKVDDKIMVRVLKVEDGKISLSRKGLISENNNNASKR